MYKDSAGAILLPAAGLALVAVLTISSLINSGPTVYRIVTVVLSSVGLVACIAAFLADGRARKSRRRLP
jgi:hypothetical protein